MDSTIFGFARTEYSTKFRAFELQVATTIQVAVVLLQVSELVRSVKNMSE